MKRLVTLSVCLMVLSCNAGGCKTKLPASDATPPVLTWNVLDIETNQGADYPGTSSLSATRGHHLRFILKSNDPEGVKSIELNPNYSGEGFWQCSSGDLAQNKYALYTGQKQTLSPDSDGNVLTQIFLILELSMAMDCPSGWAFEGGSVVLTGTSSNYFGGSTSGKVTVSVN